MPHHTRTIIHLDRDETPQPPYAIRVGDRKNRAALTILPELLTIYGTQAQLTELLEASLAALADAFGTTVTGSTEPAEIGTGTAAE